jgi:PhzF family phenazine biosynthesis protein
MIPVYIINGFIDNNKGGNPAGVVFNADKLSNADKLKIAAKVGVSETAFLSRSAVADYKLDFFTPVKQIAHCGHATIAAFSYLVQTGQLNKTISSKETIDGIRKIILKGDTAYMEQLAPKYIFVEEDMPQILLSLHLQPSDLIEEAPPLIVNTGNSFLLIGLKHTDKLRALMTEPDIIARISEKYGLIGFYPFSRQSVIPDRDATARMFGPYYGIAEEAATGMAAGPLACYLYDKLGMKKQSYLIEQGMFMPAPSPSLLTVDLSVEDNAVKSLAAGGRGKVMRQIEVGI